MWENVPSAQVTILKLQNSFGVVNTVFRQSILVGCSCHIPIMDMCVWAIQEYCQPMSLVKPESKFLHSATISVNLHLLLSLSLSLLLYETGFDKTWLQRSEPR